MLRSRKCRYRWRETSSQPSAISKDQTGRLRAARFVFARRKQEAACSIVSTLANRSPLSRHHSVYAAGETADRQHKIPSFQGVCSIE
jgi:hypothetical protein